MDIEKIIAIASVCGFDVIAEAIKKYDPIEIITACADLFNLPVDKLATYPMGGYSKKNRSGGYYFVLKDLKNNIEAYEWLYEKLNDPTSRFVFSLLMLYRLCPDGAFIKNAYDPENPQYFDKSIITTNENEIFVDCGGYIGDTVLSFIEHCGAYKRIYVYEPSKDNIEKCHINLTQKENIIIKQAGVGLKNAQLFFRGAGSSGSFVNNSTKKNIEKQSIISLDEDITESVTFIKMDIEGSEISAINGARRHISEDKPKLAICLYHIVSDIWEIPQLIHSINPHYNYYLRHYHAEHNWETVLYAIPSDEDIFGD